MPICPVAAGRTGSGLSTRNEVAARWLAAHVDHTRFAGELTRPLDIQSANLRQFEPGFPLESAAGEGRRLAVPSLLERLVRRAVLPKS
jgi:hypothetical protein